MAILCTVDASFTELSPSQISIHLNGELVKTLDYSSNSPTTPPSSQLGEGEREEEGEGERGEEGEGEGVRGDCTYSLEQLAYLRSGDKGNTANIGTCVYIHGLCIFLACLEYTLR